MKKIFSIIVFMMFLASAQRCFAEAPVQYGHDVRLIQAQRAKEWCKNKLGVRDGLFYHGGITCYSGTVPSGSSKRKLVSSIVRSRIFVVRSMGGDVGSALDVAEALSGPDKTIVVLENCLSSCANYWFLAAAYKVVGANDAVGFHGGPPALLDCEDEKIDCAMLGKLFYRSRDFIRHLGLNYRIIYTPPSGYDMSKREYVLWIFNKTELIEKWRVKGILEYDLDNS